MRVCTSCEQEILNDATILPTKTTAIEGKEGKESKESKSSGGGGGTKRSLDEMLFGSKAATYIIEEAQVLCPKCVVATEKSKGECLLARNPKAHCKPIPDLQTDAIRDYLRVLDEDKLLATFF
jgi:hypothetical protein